jgi:hypothetical protein
MAAPATLLPPGAGVALWQRLAGRYLLLPAYGAALSWERAPALLERQSVRLLALARGEHAARLERPVLVPRQIGLEDSSRSHSFAMVLEHLVIVGDRVAEIVVRLSRGEHRGEPVRTADLKPRGGLSADRAAADYGAMIERFGRRVATEVVDRGSPARFAHPWFGALRAYQWLCFAPFHQAIHLRQARAILRALERTP